MTSLMAQFVVWGVVGTVPAEAAPPVAIDPTTVTAIEIDPPAINLDDPRAVQRLIVNGKRGDRLVDLTGTVQFTSTNTAVARIDERREVIAMGDGVGEIRARFDRHEAKAPVKVTNFRRPRTIQFANEIVPIFTKHTCNSGACHGKASGQNGFKLSLLGFEPQEDHDYLVREGRGRRVFPAAPEQSLLVRKASGTAPHGGGKLLKSNDDDYQLLVAWIRQGMPYGSDKDPVVTGIEISPRQRVMDKRSTQRLRVTAAYSDGRRVDVSRHAQFQSNDDEIAQVDVAGVVTTRDYSGETAIMARYQGHVAVFRASVPTGSSANLAEFTRRNVVDELVARKWRDLGLTPSAPASDQQFVRRLYVDLVGRIPTVAETRRFLDSTAADKRDRLVDELLASPDYAAFMALKWGAILQNKRGDRGENAFGTHAMALWLKDAFHADLPYDVFVRAILTASGTPDLVPPVMWYRNVRTPEENVDNVSQLFLGTRIQCARCHHHPFEKWSQDDYWGMAAFFGRVGRKKFVDHSGGPANEAVFVRRSGAINNPKSGQPANPKGLDAAALDVAPGDDPRRLLADWLTGPAGSMFSQALVNRLWGHFFNRGIVEPIDDMRVTNPPSNPALLEALAEDFKKNGYSVRRTIRLICTSATYQLSSEPNEQNQRDRQSFARYYPRRLQAEVLLDALDLVSGVGTDFGYPAGTRAVDLPDERINSYFLDIFGRPQRKSSCECERSADANLSQTLHLLNSMELHGKLVHATGRAARLAADPRPDHEKVTEIFALIFSRPPRPDELKVAIAHITGNKNKHEAYQNLLWALINTKEFLFNT